MQAIRQQQAQQQQHVIQEQRVQGKGRLGSPISIKKAKKYEIYFIKLSRIHLNIPQKIKFDLGFNRWSQKTNW